MLRGKEYLTAVADFNDNYYAATSNISTRIAFLNKNLTTAYSFDWPYAVNTSDITVGATNIIYDPVNNFFFANRFVDTGPGYLDAARFDGDQPWKSPFVQRSIFSYSYFSGVGSMYWTQTNNYVVGHVNGTNLGYQNPVGTSLKINKLNLVPSFANNYFPNIGDTGAKTYALVDFVSDGTAIFYLGKSGNNSIITKVDMNNNGLAATFYGHNDAASIAYLNNHIYYVGGGPFGQYSRRLVKVSAVTGLTVATSEIIPDIGVAIFASIEGDLWIFGGQQVVLMDENLNIVDIFTNTYAPNYIPIPFNGNEYLIQLWQPLGVVSPTFNYLPTIWMNRIENDEFMVFGNTLSGPGSLFGSFLIGSGGGWSVGRIGV
jgi:hypothetical protein